MVLPEQARSQLMMPLVAAEAEQHGGSLRKRPGHFFGRRTKNFVPDEHIHENENRQAHRHQRDITQVRRRSILGQLLQSESPLVFLKRRSQLIRRVVLAIVAIIFCETLRKKLRGSKVDKYLKRRVVTRTFARQKAELDTLGVKLPAVKQDHLLNLNSFAAMREILRRREQRGQTIQALEVSLAMSTRGHSAIPRVVFIPNPPLWIPPRPGILAGWTRLPFDETEMRWLIEDYWPSLLKVYDSLPSHAQVGLWCFCAVYAFGGVFVGPRHLVAELRLTHLLGASGPLFTSDFVNPLAVVIVEKSWNASSVPLFVAATPRHPLLRCILQTVETSESTVMEAIGLLAVKSRDVPPVGASPGVIFWQRLIVSRDDGHQQFSPCSAFDKEVIAGTPEFSDRRAIQGSLYLGLFSQSNRGEEKNASHIVSVRILESSGHARSKVKKKSLLSRLVEKGAVPGWVCNRCLNYAEMGSYEKCASYCPRQYEEIICGLSEIGPKAVVPIDVRVVGNPSRAIPRVIHQTFFEDVTVDRYPTLYRLKNSWRRSGWDYRFYNDDQARRYICDNFPRRFLDAFDSLIYGAYKADLFRYLVLMKDGGVYADIDIMLETNVDTFLTPSTTFFAARDVVGEYAGQPFCLWNGLLGASPVHPFMVRAVERLTSLIENRADLYDMEHEVCRRNGKGTNTWKVREEPLLFLSGPCGLGVAVNEALNRSSTASFESGWLSLEDLAYAGQRDFGDALILVGDKFDMGAFRISDPEMDVVVASTDLPHVDKTPRNASHPSKADLLRRPGHRNNHLHYSESNKGGLVWGSQNVYLDDLVSNQEIQLVVHYETS